VSKELDKAWSMLHEGHLNKNNIIFNEKLKRLVRDLEEVNNSLGHYALEYDDKNTWEHLDRFDNSHECESGCEND